MGRELDPAKVSVIRNGIDVRTISSTLSVREAKQRLHLPEGALVVGAAARLEEVKRLDLFLDAATRISRDLPDTQFVIAGAAARRSLSCSWPATVASRAAFIFWAIATTSTMCFGRWISADHIGPGRNSMALLEEWRWKFPSYLEPSGAFPR